MAWLVLAAAGVYPLTLVPALGACLAVAFFHPPRIATEPSMRTMDVCALAIVVAGLVQLLPLPRAAAGTLSPASARVDAALALTAAGGAHPLSIDPVSTMMAAGIFAGLVLLYLTARQALETGGVRRVALSVAVTAILVSALALAQDATGRGRLYWGLVPIGEGPAPFGPFINRNHFATWSIMAISLCLGYLRAHASAHGGASAAAARRSRVAAAFDGRAMLLAAAAVLMLVATFRSLSRSGLLGLAAALVVFWRLSAAKDVRHGSWKGAGHLSPLMLVVLAAGMGIVLYVDPQTLAARFGGAAPAAVDRLTIWRETIPIIRDSWLTGTGLGTYLTAMLVYQQTHAGVIFNQAHNHYLQIAAEGGLLAAIPAALALSALVRAGSRALRDDTSGIGWIRAGAAAGLAGVAAQSVWETGLTMPANGALAAVLLAVLLHAPAGERGGAWH